VIVDVRFAIRDHHDTDAGETFFEQCDEPGARPLGLVTAGTEREPR
jgi:hypothetical protein